MKVKKKMAAVLALVLVLAGCSRTTDNASLSETAQNSESTVQENVNGEQTEIKESENREQEKVSESGNNETVEDASASDTTGSVVYMTTDISPVSLLQVII